MRFAHLASFIALFAAPAIAGVNLEYGEEYETAYLDRCTQDHSRQACRCVMEALQSRVGFVAFAEEIDAHRHHFMERSELRVLAADLLGRCTAVGRIQ